MSGTSYDSPCPRCGGTMMCYQDWKPREFVSGECMDCGYTYVTIDNLMTEKELEQIRKDYEWKKKPKKFSKKRIKEMKEWDKYIGLDKWRVVWKDRKTKIKYPKTQ